MSDDILSKPGLFTFTGNPIVDSGMAVLAVIAGKESIDDVKPFDIISNIDGFFQTFKHQYNDPNATEEEKQHVKRKLKQHLILLYLPNHYLHGNNNKSFVTYDVTLKTKEIDGLSTHLSKLSQDYKIIDISKKNKQELAFKFISDNKDVKPDKDYLTNIIQKHEPNYEYEIKRIARATVSTNNEYFDSFKNIIIELINGSHKIITERKQEGCLCNFCGKDADIALSKDLFPMTRSMSDVNLGNIYCCRYCHLATLFSFLNFNSFKSDIKKSGIYYLLYFSNPYVMVEYSKQQLKYLSDPTNLASLRTKVGGKYDSVFNDLYERIATLKALRTNPSSVIVYFLQNQNEDMKVIYETMALPSGLLNFWLYLNTMELSKEWAIIHKKIMEGKDYKEVENNYFNFIHGDLPIYKFKNNKKEVVIQYLKEVTLMKDELISTCEKLSEKLKGFFQKLHENYPTRRDHWTAEFHDFFEKTKPYEFFYELLSMNNEHFKRTGGENLISVSETKMLLSEGKQFNLLFGLIEYLMLNSLTEEEKELYFVYHNKRKNK